jgi:predicted nucleic acid-binding protein
MYLLDTNVISELRKMRGNRVPASVIAWWQTVDLLDCYLSVITVQEIETGILLVERTDTPQSQAIRRWLEQLVLRDFEGRILSIDIPTARSCARLHVPTKSPYRDSLIAATAIAHGMTVVTRNVSDFVRSGVRVINPWGNE